MPCPCGVALAFRGGRGYMITAVKSIITKNIFSAIRLVLFNFALRFHMKATFRIIAICFIAIIISISHGWSRTPFVLPATDHGVKVFTSPAAMPPVAQAGYHAPPEFPYKLRIVIRTKALQSEVHWFVAPVFSFRCRCFLTSVAKQYFIYGRRWMVTLPHDTSQHRGPPAVLLV